MLGLTLAMPRLRPGGSPDRWPRSPQPASLDNTATRDGEPSRSRQHLKGEAFPHVGIAAVSAARFRTTSRPGHETSRRPSDSRHLSGPALVRYLCTPSGSHCSSTIGRALWTEPFTKKAVARTGKRKRSDENLLPGHV